MSRLALLGKVEVGIAILYKRHNLAFRKVEACLQGGKVLFSNRQADAELIVALSEISTIIEIRAQIVTINNVPESKRWITGRIQTGKIAINDPSRDIIEC